MSRKSGENEILDNVTVFESGICAGVKTNRGEVVRHANVRVRIPRILTVGNSFASRAGQKGVMSVAFQNQEMSFIESQSHQTFCSRQIAFQFV